ncbi:MAG TPA: nuclear transport factor 2 family protein [Allosphingosinicella sp.]|nr:nuclear transport factor 2 family protein [Allosphingosinicella sp.]
MRRTILISLPFLLFLPGPAAAAGAQGQPVAAEAAWTPAEREVRALERSWLDAYQRNDVAAMTGIVADDFILTYPNGSLQTKADLLREMRAMPPGPSANRYHTRGVTSRSYGDTVILRGTVVTEAEVNGQTGRDVSTYTDVYIRRNGRWQVVASHLSGSRGN